MKASEQCKKLGFNMSTLCTITKQSRQTLTNWSNNKPELFKTVLEGAKSVLASRDHDLMYSLESKTDDELMGMIVAIIEESEGSELPNEFLLAIESGNLSSIREALISGLGDDE